MVKAGGTANSTILEAAGPDAETRKNAGISTADDFWQQGLAEKKFVFLIPGGSARGSGKISLLFRWKSRTAIISRSLCWNPIQD